jgi:tRNA threonylcarbamoyladenosine biosynthesis protein TsaB
VLVLGIETSTRVGSVALVRDGQLLAEARHDTPSAHGERLLGLVRDIMQSAGCSSTELSRVAVGRGPGSFTGLRIGLALAQGIAMGLRIPALGIDSLRAMALGLPDSALGLRVSLMDARRGELFLAAYDCHGDPCIAPRVIGRSDVIATLQQEFVNSPAAATLSRASSCYLLGTVADELLPTELDREALSALGVAIHRSPQTDYPGAYAVALSVALGRHTALPTPEYLRDADAVLPNLPPCPLDLPRP